MSSHTSPAPAPIAPPEGEHFAFDDDGTRVRLVVFSRQGAWRRLAMGIAVIGALSATVRYLTSGGIAFYVILGIIAALIVWLGLQAWLGFESTEITSAEIRIRRYLFPFSRIRTLPRSQCEGIGLVPDRPIARGEDAPMEPEVVGTTMGRIAFVGRCERAKEKRLILDFGDVLTRFEARLVKDFLLVKMPELREVTINVLDVYVVPKETRR